jgi:hypothetical protein
MPQNAEHGRALVPQSWPFRGPLLNGAGQGRIALSSSFKASTTT